MTCGDSGSVAVHRAGARTLRQSGIPRTKRRDGTVDLGSQNLVKTLATTQATLGCYPTFLKCYGCYQSEKDDLARTNVALLSLSSFGLALRIRKSAKHCCGAMTSPLFEFFFITNTSQISQFRAAAKAASRFYFCETLLPPNYASSSLISFLLSCFPSLSHINTYRGDARPMQS